MTAREEVKDAAKKAMQQIRPRSTMKNKMTTTIDLDKLLADVNKSRKNGKLSEHSVVKLTLEWELDVDEDGVEPVPDDDAMCTTEDAPAAQKDTTTPGGRPDWRSTLAQFPNE